MYRVTKKDAALVPVRAAMAATMLYHGVSKLRGEGPRETGQMFEQLGIKPGERWARLTGLAEVAAGATSILGFATRIGALAVIATQAVAIAKVHGPKGYSNMSGGYEYNLSLLAMALGLLVAGPGSLSGHELIERRVERRPWRLARRAPRRAFRLAMAVK